MIDVLVAGAGPAGLATALYAARAGLQTVVIEPRPQPIDKACGEGLMPGAVRALAELGVHPDGHRIAGIQYLRAGYCAQASFRNGPGLGVRRTTLQRQLLDAAAAAGVRVEQATVSTIEQDERSVTAAGWQARYLVAADGLHSPIRRRLGLDAGARSERSAGPARPPGSAGSPGGARRRWGQRQHFRIAPITDFVQVHWSTDCEAYLTPVADDTIGVAVLSSRPASFETLLESFPAVARIIDGAEALGPVSGAGPLRQRSRARVDGRVLLVGDAAGYVDALTGEGIAVALASARALVGCLAADRPADYERAWRRTSLRYRTLTETLLWARSRQPLNTAIVPAAQRAPWLFSAVVNQLAR